MGFRVLEIPHFKRAKRAERVTRAREIASRAWERARRLAPDAPEGRAAALAILAAVLFCFALVAGWAAADGEERLERAVPAARAAPTPELAVLSPAAPVPELAPPAKRPRPSPPPPRPRPQPQQPVTIIGEG
jgi:hypothetical protein